MQTEEKIEPIVETNWRRIIGMAFIVIAVICFGYYGICEIRDYRAAKKLENLQKAFRIYHAADMVNGVRTLSYREFEFE